MTDDHRIDITIIGTSAAVAVLAIATSLLSIGQPLQLLAALGAVAFGPGALAYRLITGARWSQCLMVGVAVNIAALMVLALTIVAVHFWHPKVELLIPLATCVLSGVLYRRGGQGEWSADGRENPAATR